MDRWLSRRAVITAETAGHAGNASGRVFSASSAVSRGVAAALLSMLAIAVGSPQQKQYPYQTVRDQRGTVPPVPRLLPSPPLGDGPFAFQTTEQNFRVIVVQEFAL
jgi:hypothetical protein